MCVQNSKNIVTSCKVKCKHELTRYSGLSFTRKPRDSYAWTSSLYSEEFKPLNRPRFAGNFKVWELGVMTGDEQSPVIKKCPGNPGGSWHPGSGIASSMRSWFITATRVCRTFSIRYKEHLAEAGTEPWVDSWGDSSDNALAETIIALNKTERPNRRRPWKSLKHVSPATLEWVWWFNKKRLLESNGYIPEMEYEEAFHSRKETHTLDAVRI